MTDAPRFPPESTGASGRVTVQPMVARTFAAMLRDTWREFLDAKVLYLLLLAIALLFGTALTGRIEPQPGGRQYLDIAARALAADLDGIDIATQSMGDVAGRLNGSFSTITAGVTRPRSTGALRLTRVPSLLNCSARVSSWARVSSACCWRMRSRRRSSRRRPRSFS